MSAASTDSPRLVLRSSELADTLAIGRAIGSLCREGDVLALAGELGAGKTQLVRGLAGGLGLDPTHVASPTFVFLHEYEHEPARAQPDALSLIHLDAYRLTGSDDLASIGFDLDDPDYQAGCVVAVEWPQRLGPSIEPGLTLTLQHAPPSRRIVVDANDSWRDRLETLRHALAPFLSMP